MSKFTEDNKESPKDTGQLEETMQRGGDRKKTGLKHKNQDPQKPLEHYSRVNISVLNTLVNMGIVWQYL